jgi:hypothetical protein
MAGFLLLALAGLGLFTVTGVVRHFRRRLAKVGVHALTFRWLFAPTNWAGKPVTNRGWNRPGTKALTATGFAHRRWYWTGWQHAAWRIQWTVAALLLAAGLALRFRPAEQYLELTALTAGCAGLARARAGLLNWGHRRNHVKPLHIRLAPVAGIPVALRPESWLDIPRNLSYVQVTFPKNHQLPKAEDRKAIETVAAATIPGMKNGRPSWRTVGPRLVFRLTPPVLPPLRVYLDRIEWGYRNPPQMPADAILRAIRAASADEFVLGIGENGQVMTVSLTHDSAHYAVSVDTGGGKSVLVRAFVPQVLFKGGIALILDNKLVSHPSLRGLPNVAYADDIEKIHEALCWLDGELTTRGQYIRAHTDELGVLYGSPGPRLFVILEEQNLLINRLKAYWAERIAEDKARAPADRQHLPPTSPAVRAFTNASYVGRELKVHLVFISQRLTAEAVGGSQGAAVRMNLGTRILGGYDEDTWKMLVGKSVPMPPPSRNPGRMQIYVRGRDPQEVQVVFFTHAQARQLASEGQEHVPAALRHLTEFRAAPDARVAGPVPGTVVVGGDGSAVAPPALAGPPRGNWMTINQAREQGLLPRSWSTNGAFRTAKHRAAKAGVPVPKVQATRRGEALYDAVQLADFLERIAG